MLGQRWLQFKRQNLFGAPGQKVQEAAHAPQKIFAPAEGLRFLCRVEPGLDGSRTYFLTQHIFRKPMQRMQIAQAAFAVLDVGFDLVAALARPARAIVALAHFCIDEFARRAAHDIGTEPVLQFGKQLRIAVDDARIEQRGTDCKV